MCSIARERHGLLRIGRRRAGVRWSGRRRVLGLLASAMFAAPVPAATVDPGALVPPETLAQLRASGLIGTGHGIRPFRWTTVTTRPMRSPRRYRETFAGTPPGAPAGLSAMVRDELDEDDAVKRTVQRVSARGLIHLKPGRAEPDVRIEGLHLPLSTGARFHLEYDDGSGRLIEDCVVGDDRAASSVHPAIPGRATQIDCSGTGRYMGIPVKVEATVLYLQQPGVFVSVSQEIHAPIGRLRSGTSIVDFSMKER